MNQKERKQHLSLEKKMEAIRMYDEGFEVKLIGERFKVTTAAIFNWLKRRDELIIKLQNTNKSTKKGTITSNYRKEENQNIQENYGNETVSNNYFQQSSSNYSYIQQESYVIKNNKEKYQANEIVSNNYNEPSSSNFRYIPQKNHNISNSERNYNINNTQIELLNYNNVPKYMTQEVKGKRLQKRKKEISSYADTGILEKSIKMENSSKDGEMPKEIQEIILEYEKVVKEYNMEYDTYKSLLQSLMQLSNRDSIEGKILTCNINKCKDRILSEDFKKLSKTASELQEILFS